MQKNVEKMSINYSPNFYLRKRSSLKIKYLIFHYTGMKSENGAIKRLTSEHSKVSCHYFIKKNGKIIQIVPDLYIAWHAGTSSWKNDKFLNSNSIGIEISNPGHAHGYCNFSSKQIKSIISLSKKLKLIDTFKETIKEEIENGSLVLSLAKKKFAKTFINEKATTPYPKKFKAIDVIKTSLDEKEPYPNNPLTISSDAKIKARLAGKDRSKDNSIYLF